MKCLKIAERVNQWVEKKGSFLLPSITTLSLTPTKTERRSGTIQPPQHSNAIPTAHAS
ncbi:hypothetical protein [Treponema sp. OMZ 838]|uniref:hypothetical protein n=1 Tax=Treponema sp. OMZ 838 TaxID=1539298 RepID=UPI000A3FA74F|nr:hypothetical protein [Treponema sp. OMZ 838]